MNENSFPFYCKLSNEKSYYKVESPDVFIELQRLGSLISKYKIVANQYPEKLRIMDMMELKDGIWIASSKAEFDALEVKVKG